jgi:hypothetical protein
MLSIKIVLSPTYQVLENKPVQGVQGLLAIWNRWDALAYQQLAQFGYQISGEFKTWFYPLFLWTVRLVAWARPFARSRPGSGCAHSTVCG